MNGPSPADEQWWWYPLLSSSAPVQLQAVSAVPPSIVPAGTSSTVGEQVPSQRGVCEERPLHCMKPNERCGTTHQRHSRSPRLEPWGVVTTQNDLTPKVFLTFRTFWCVFWGTSLDQTSPGHFCLGGYSNRANMFQRPKDWPWDSTCVAPHARKSHSTAPTAGASHRPAHQLLRPRNPAHRHSTTTTRARQASTSALVRLPSTVLACPNAYALQVLAADSARPPAQSPLGVALERTRVRTRSVTTHATLPL